MFGVMWAVMINWVGGGAYCKSLHDGVRLCQTSVSADVA